MKVMVKSDFKTFPYISLGSTFSRNLSLPVVNPGYLLVKFGEDAVEMPAVEQGLANRQTDR